MDRIALVQDFMEKFGASRDPDLWLKLCEEESKELMDALSAVVKEACDLAYVLRGLHIACGEDAEKTEWYIKKVASINQIIGIADNFFEAVDDGLFDDAFREVHLSNLSKLGEDGKPVKREDGKVLKGPNYRPADIDAVIRQHYGMC
jgi:predicted HAD superfamily Cof-like phosphohydrolase